VKESDRSDTLSEEDVDNSELVSCWKKIAKVKSNDRSHESMIHNIYFKKGFCSDGDETNSEPMRVLCDDTLSNDAMKQSKLNRQSAT